MNKTELKELIKEEIIDILSEASKDDIELQKGLNKELESTIASYEKASGHLKTIKDLTTEDEDEPTSSQLKGASKDSVAVLARKLQQTSSELKSTANKWKRSEGEEKEKLKNRLITLTKIKKELESML
jgi:hypothetical protein|tara:strand:- start:6 stop:389 length:384 start_codon:yes stop_codon:yes gene_type:complete